MEIRPVAKIENDYKNKFAIPRQSGIADLKSKIIFEKEYCSPDAVRGLEGYSHIWLIWGFSDARFDGVSLTVRPPRLGGNERVGVFASRSPYRPNSLGLSSVKLEKIEYDEKGHPVLTVSGADLLSGSPIYDIKPYIKFTDSHRDAVSGFADSVNFNILDVEIDDGLLAKIPKEKRSAFISILSNDPRPAYQNDSERIYGFGFAEFEIKFRVKDSTLTVLSIENEE